MKAGPKTRRKGGGVAAKSTKVDELSDQLAASTAVIVTEYRGLTVQDLQDLRRRLRPRGVEYHVVKNSLFARAADKSGRVGMREMLSGPTAVALGALDEVELAKGFVDETRTLRAMKIMGAFVGGRVLSGEDVQSLARLPSRAELNATIVAGVQAPLASVTSVLQAPLMTLVQVLSARGA
ncbi:MAG: 50S ribosomal protein L10 [Candidatus Limnocylindria bacterium]